MTYLSPSVSCFRQYPGQHSGQLPAPCSGPDSGQRHGQLPARCSRRSITWIFLLLFLSFVTVFTSPSGAQAASLASIRSCELTSSSKFRVTVKIPNTKKIHGKRIYLFSLRMNESSPAKGDKPIASAAKKKNVTFKVSFKSSSLQEVLNRKYLVAQKKSNGSYSALCRFRYLTNASKNAKYRYSFPKALSKKGLQVKGEMQEDAEELGVQHSLINIVFSELLAKPSEQNESTSLPFDFGGNTYWFRRSVIASYDSQLRKLSSDGAVISAVLLLGYRDDLLSLIYPDGREAGHNFYAWNYKDTSARKTFEAMITFLAQRYSARNGSNGRIVNWIVGNEVNSCITWNYAGRKSLKNYAVIYANAFRLTYNAVTSVYANARIYISLDHLWNTKHAQGFTSRQMLDEFASCIARNGYIQWNLAYHPYGSPLTEPRFWENANKQTTSSLKSPVINMNNLSLLTGYIRSKYGKKTRIILSEQGYNSNQNGVSRQKEQAAAIVYSYYLTEADDMVDSFIMNRHVDHTTETAQGLSLGLWTTSDVESADEKKISWNVYKYMDTSLSEKVSKSSLKVIGASKWSKLISGFTKKLVTKVSLRKGTLTTVNRYSGGRKINVAGWKAYGAVSSFAKSSDAVHAVHTEDANRNRLWGVVHTFSDKLSMKNRPVLNFTAKVDGAASSKVLLKVRVFSGKKIFECEKTVPSDKAFRYAVSLKGWTGISKITKIQIMAAPAGGSWKSNAAITVSSVQCHK